MIKVFDTTNDFEGFTEGGMKSGNLYYVKEDNSVHFTTNNIDGTNRNYDVGVGGGGSDVDLSSYATITYVNDKISEVIGGAPETLDTLKELADALENDASLSYVTEALAGKANVNDVYTKTEVDNLIPEPVDLSNYTTTSYVTTELDKKANINDVYTKTEVDNLIPESVDPSNYATTSYVTTELDKKADKTDIVQADMCETDTTSKSYVLNNPYQYHVKSLNGTYDNCYNLVIPHNAKQYNFSDQINSTLVIGDDHDIMASYGIIQGKGNKIHNICEAAFGRYNECDTNWNPTIFTVGNGTASKKHNAFAIRVDGTIYIADNEVGTPYSLQSRLNSKANANDVYTKTEIDNMIPESSDLSNYVSYTQANSYYMTVEGPKQVINSPKTFVGNKRIIFRQGTSTDKLGFTLFNIDEKEVGGLEWRPDTINGKPLMSLQQYISTVNMDIIPQAYLGFRQARGNSKYHLLAPIPTDVATIEYIGGSDYKNFFMPLVFKNGSNKVYTDCTGLVDMTSLMPDMTNYVPITSYNALAARVEELANWIVSYHTPTPTQTPT